MTSTRNSGLLAGLLAALGLVLLSSSATMAREEATTSDLLPGVDLVTEEVEPGVYRVASDGVRDLSRLAEYKKLPLHGLLDGNITAGLDGSVWWFGPSGFFRLGDQLTHEWSKPYRQNRVFAVDDFAVAPDGTLWRSKPEYDTTNAASFDGQS